MLCYTWHDCFVPVETFQSDSQPISEERKPYRPQVPWERWCRIVAAAGTAQMPVDEYFAQVIENGLPETFRK